MHNPLAPRQLSYDEKKAAEAAFRGLPCDPNWSATARAIYDGIATASGGRFQTVQPPIAEETQETMVQLPATGQEAQEAAQETAHETETDGADRPSLSDVPQTQDQPDGDSRSLDASRPSLRSREEAIQAGLLIDVTPLAQSLGLPLPIGITRPLWQLAITASEEVPEEQREARLRDVLMALRLRLSTTRMSIPWIEFPALLSFPPESIPQVCVLHAVAHGHDSQPLSLTLALREEIATIITPLNN